MEPEVHREEAKSLQTYVGLMTENQWALRSFIVSLMPGSPDVDDVLQETNIVLWQKRKRFKLGTNFLAWASRVARYEVMHHRDRVKRVAVPGFSDELLDILADEMDPGDSKKPLLAALDICLDKLNQKQRDLVMLRYTPGKTLKEHASRVGTSAESLRVTLHRIRQGLKHCIENTSKGQAT